MMKIEFLYKMCKDFIKKMNDLFVNEPKIDIQEDFENKHTFQKKNVRRKVFQ